MQAPLTKPEVDRRLVRAACPHDCPDTCALEVTVENGIAVKVEGAKLVAIDPCRSLTADKCHEHLALLPGTDGALALAMMHVIVGENLHDRDYVGKYTLGFERLAERVKDYPPQEVAAITGLPAERIVALAREYAGTRPAAYRVRVFNDRGGFTARARVSERAREGVVAALSVWWKKLAADRANANDVTSQAITDIGRGATFYDCLVEVMRVGRAPAGVSAEGAP